MMIDSLPNPDGKDGVFEMGMTTCPTCGESFMKKRGWQVFCGERCRMGHHQQERKEAVESYRRMKHQRFADKGEDVNRGNG